MAEGINRWLGLGNLVADAELRQLQSGASLSFRVACNERYKDRSGEWQERTQFVPCVWFGKRAEAVAQYMRKGTQVLVDGRFSTRSWEKDGQKHYASEIVVTDAKLLGGGGQSGGASGNRGRAAPASDGGDVYEG